MDKNENIIDLGVWNVPKSWDEVTLKQYQEIERLYEGKNENVDVRKIVHILIDKDEDYINALPIDFLEEIMGYLAFLQDPIPEQEPKNWIEIDGERYTVHTENQLKTGEYIASDTVLKGDRHNYAAILAILCRKDGELYDSKFENEVLEDRIKLFEKQPITKILCIIGFFLELYITFMTPSLLSSKVREAIALERENILNLRKSGALSILSTKSAIRKLKKLEKSINSI